jgi:UPF0716 family protein affecting phage T7 exclusion
MNSYDFMVTLVNIVSVVQEIQAIQIPKPCFRKRNRFPLVSCLLILLLSRVVEVSSNNNVSKETFLIEYEMALEPFQVLLEYDDSFPMPKSDEMIVLSSTQLYLTNQLQLSEPDFQRIVLYQYVRDYVMESREHFAKIAMNGIVFFASPITDDFKSRILNRILQKLSDDSDQFIAVLHEEGMNHVVNVTLLSIQGNELTYENGKMVVKTEPEAAAGQTEELSRDMGDDMQKNVLLLCLLVPGLVVTAAAGCFLVRMTREIKWNCSTQNQNLWQSKGRFGNTATIATERANELSEVKPRKFPDIDDLSDISSETDH